MAELEYRLTETQEVMIALSEKIDRWETDSASAITVFVAQIIDQNPPVAYTDDFNEALAELKSRGAIETGYRLVRIIDRESIVTAARRP